MHHWHNILTERENRMTKQLIKPAVGFLFAFFTVNAIWAHSHEPHLPHEAHGPILYNATNTVAMSSAIDNTNSYLSIGLVE
jgi:hypothetical protein